MWDPSLTCRPVAATLRLLKMHMLRALQVRGGGLLRWLMDVVAWVPAGVDGSSSVAAAAARLCVLEGRLPWDAGRSPAQCMQQHVPYCCTHVSNSKVRQEMHT